VAGSTYIIWNAVAEGLTVTSDDEWVVRCDGAAHAEFISFTLELLWHKFRLIDKHIAVVVDRS